VNVDYNAFEGMPIEGRLPIVRARGRVAARDAKCVGAPGLGNFLDRESNHF
jgi:hypothetical protein